MKSKRDIVENWLPRYTKRPIEEFTEYLLLTNFNNYVELFAEWYGVPVLGRDGTIIIAAFGLPIPKLIMVIPLAEAFIMVPSRPKTGTPYHSAKSST